MSTSTKIRIRWDRIVGATAVGIVIGAFAWWGLSILSDQQGDAHGGLPRCTDTIADAGGSCWGEPLPPCPTEDSDDCYWDAAVRSDGRGSSFYIEDGVAHYEDGTTVDYGVDE